MPTTYNSYNSKRFLEVLAFDAVTDIPADFHGIAQIADGTVFACHAGTNTEINLTAGNALTSAPLSQFAATTSEELLGVLSDATGTGAAVFAESPEFVTPVLGTPTSGNLENCGNLPLGGVTITPEIVTGSKASGAALTSLLAGLVALGLITDSTEA